MTWHIKDRQWTHAVTIKCCKLHVWAKIKCWYGGSTYAKHLKPLHIADIYRWKVCWIGIEQYKIIVISQRCKACDLVSTYIKICKFLCTYRQGQTVYSVTWDIYIFKILKILYIKIPYRLLITIQLWQIGEQFYAIQTWYSRRTLRNIYRCYIRDLRIWQITITVFIEITRHIASKRRIRKRVSYGYAIIRCINRANTGQWLDNHRCTHSRCQPSLPFSHKIPPLVIHGLFTINLILVYLFVQCQHNVINNTA